jgi:microcystin-dependent protein
LYAALGTNVLRDKRGRVEAGVDGGTNRITAEIPGGALGSVGGVERHTLAIAELPSHRHRALIHDLGHDHTYDQPTNLAQKTGGTGTSVFQGTIPANTGIRGTGIQVNSDDGGGLDTTNATGGGAGHPNLQPTIVVQKIIRAC